MFQPRFVQEPFDLEVVEVGDAIGSHQALIHQPFRGRHREEQLCAVLEGLRGPWLGFVLSGTGEADAMSTITGLAEALKGDFCLTCGCSPRVESSPPALPQTR